MAAHARDVNILIWTSHKSVDHGTNDRVMVHGGGTRADGRRSRFCAPFEPDRGLASWLSRAEHRGVSSNVVAAQAGYLARPTIKAPETQIYFIIHGSGPFPVLRLRTVVRGERAGRSIVHRTTALWSIWMMSSLILAGLGTKPRFRLNAWHGFVVSRGSNGISRIAQWSLMRVRWTLPLTNGRKRT